VVRVFLSKTADVIARLAPISHRRAYSMYCVALSRLQMVHAPMLLINLWGRRVVRLARAQYREEY
jgi:hypothetical protein